jgi:tRNA U34 5-carboxymethylaminomethyl modifying enzyme MnmG/GidA
MFEYSNKKIINNKENYRLVLTLNNGQKRVCETVFNIGVSEQEMEDHANNLIENLNQVEIEAIEEDNGDSL